MAKNIFTDKEIEKVRTNTSIEGITVPATNPQHREMMDYVLRESLGGRKPDLTTFNQSDLDIEDVYKDLLEILGDNDSADLVNNLEERIRIAAEKDL